MSCPREKHFSTVFQICVHVCVGAHNDTNETPPSNGAILPCIHNTTLPCIHNTTKDEAQVLAISIVWILFIK